MLLNFFFTIYVTTCYFISSIQLFISVRCSVFKTDTHVRFLAFIRTARYNLRLTLIHYIYILSGLFRINKAIISDEFLHSCIISQHSLV